MQRERDGGTPRAPLAIGRAGRERHDAEGDDDVKLNDVDVHGVSPSDLWADASE
jgi:hypothetical protein